MIFRVLSLAFLAVFLTACQDETDLVIPGPVSMTEEAVGHYCQMGVLEHDGPKAQIHLAHLDQPIWFTQVRDAIVYMRLPEETADITAVYVHDMGKADSWQSPGKDNWVDAKDAYFVIESTMTGGMGAPEAVPFANAEAADRFIADHGGRRVRLDAIPDDYVLAPIEVSAVRPEPNG